MVYATKKNYLNKHNNIKYNILTISKAQNSINK